MKNKRTWRLPNGDLTSSAMKMVRAWEDIYKPICKVTGSTVIGFDPDILFRDPYGKSFNLSTTIAQKLSEVIKTLEDVVEKHSSPQPANVAFLSIDAAKIVLTPPAKPESAKPRTYKNPWVKSRK